MSWCVDTKAEATWSRPQIVHEPVELERLMWESLDRGDAVFKVTRVVMASVEVPYPPNTTCACGDLIHPDMPYVDVEADGVLWHGNPEGGSHRADVDPT